MKDALEHGMNVFVIPSVSLSVDEQGNPLEIINQKGKKVKYHIVAREGYYAPKS